MTDAAPSDRPAAPRRKRRAARAPTEWTCSACGSSVTAHDVALPLAIGWKITSDTTGICAPCGKLASRSST